MERNEADEQIKHLRRLIDVHLTRRRVLELQAAQAGGNVRPEVLIEIATITTEIERYEQDIARVRTQAAVDILSVAEVEYRVLVAETWDTPEGRPSVLGAAKLERGRLQLGIPPERARAIEQEVREGLARETLAALDVGTLIEVDHSGTLAQPAAGSMGVTISPSDGGTVTIQNIHLQQTVTTLNPVGVALRLVGRAIRLDVNTAITLMIVCIPQQAMFDLSGFAQALHSVNQTVLFPDDQQHFERFVREFSDSRQAGNARDDFA